ncbi:MAG: hypothetical protein ACI9M3_000820 [Bacteroidia bacterium]|jgi:hypothetical protein
MQKIMNYTKEDDLDAILNDALNKALITNRIKGIPDSNKIAYFVIDYIKERDLFLSKIK